jgi:hypothetical protein
MARTISLEVYKLEELSEKARDRAHYDWLASGCSDGSSSENAATLRAFESIFPVKVKDWQYGGCPGYIEWHFTGEDDTAELTGWRLAAYLWNNYHGKLYKGKYYSTPGKYIDGKYTYKHRHSKIILEHCCVLTGYCVDDDMLDPVYKFMEHPTDGTTFYNLMQDCFDAWVKACTEQWDHENSMEYFKDACEANDYEFYADGRMA